VRSAVLKRSIVIAGHKTSVSLEDEFWESLKEIAGERGVTLGELVRTIDANRNHTNLSSTIRLSVLGFYRDQRGARDKTATDVRLGGTPSVGRAKRKAPVAWRGRGFEADRVRHLKSPASPSSPNLERRVSVPEALGKTC
jgi:predicted DNA-binding ribbon-helix-helix protein